MKQVTALPNHPLQRSWAVQAKRTGSDRGAVGTRDPFRGQEDAVSIKRKRWLSGFPHPFGANGHRARLSEDNRMSLGRQLHEILHSTIAAYAAGTSG
jgi:hypothetical protein